MKKQGQEKSFNTKTEDNPELNPRKAAIKLKEMQVHLEIMRNRFKVIEGHDQYQRYRTLDQSRRIEHHNSIHQRISKQKEELKLSLEKLQDKDDTKQKNDQLRIQIREKIKEARKSLLEDRQERSQVINEQFQQNWHKIKQSKVRDLEENKAKKNQILIYEDKKRQNLKKHYQAKIITTILSKSKDSMHLRDETSHLNKELEKMMEKEKKMMEESNRSLQASRVMNSKFSDIMTTKCTHSYKLPQIRKSINGTTTAKSDLISQ